MSAGAYLAAGILVAAASTVCFILAQIRLRKEKKKIRESWTCQNEKTE